MLHHTTIQYNKCFCATVRSTLATLVVHDATLIRRNELRPYFFVVDSSYVCLPYRRRITETCTLINKVIELTLIRDEFSANLLTEEKS